MLYFHTLRQKVTKLMMILTTGCMAGFGVDCDFEDGDLYIDLPQIRFADDHYDEYYYEEYYYEDDFFPCCW